MTLRRTLLAAALPALLTLAALGAYAVFVVEQLGEQVDDILDANYRSIVAVRTLRDVADDVERMLLSPDVAAGAPAIAARLEAFAEALAVQRANLTEEGEAEVTRDIEAACAAWERVARAAAAMPPGPSRVEAYVEVVHPRAEAIRAAARPVVAVNQDAILAKASRAGALIERLRGQLVTASLACFGLVVVISVLVAGRVSRPLAALTTAVRRIGEGDLDRPLPPPGGTDEVTTLQAEVGRMLDALRAYRRSSLGELLAAQQLAQAAIDSLRDPVISFRPDATVGQVSQPAAEVLGIDPAATDPLAPVPAPLREAIERARDTVLAGRGPVVPDGLEAAIPVVLGGAARHAQVHATPTASPTDGVGIVGATILVRDVTSLHAAAALKDDLLSTVAHELRTPLTSLRMAVHLCLEQVVGPLTERQQELLVAAREDAERLHALVEGILAVSRIEGGGLAARRRPVPLAELVEAALAPARVPAADRRVQLACEGPLEGVVEVDGECAALALGNLVHNAIRHTPEGGRVLVRASPSAPGWVRLEVRDDGPGVPPEHRARLFSRFYRVPGSPPGGTGLGLSIARDVVHAHGGEIGVDGAPGQGSAFWLTLPLARGGPA
ncbi:MAG: HAMP domain-containing protein [Planctomycetes bacterium]|nr:HAMP domain-containing protein [Planctomycetota bacterium]